MPDLLLELFSEEIPARMQARAAEDLRRLVTDHMVEAGLTYSGGKAFSTPRRLVLALSDLAAETPDTVEERKGPRVDAPEKALDGFLRSTGLTKDDLEARDDKKGQVWFATIRKQGRPADEVVAEAVEHAVRNFPWPKSMRWGAGTLRWVRPLHTILCILTDEAGHSVVPLDIDGIKSGDKTRGHRFLAPDAVSVTGFDDYSVKLENAFVVLDPQDRMARIKADADNLAFAQGCQVVEDKGLLAEVAGLVEWPVVLMGEIGADFLDLPPEVLQTSMREHQKFFSVRSKNGRIERFITVANTSTADDGATILAGNQKVLAARLADAKFFWENDLRTIDAVGLPGMAKPLANVTFHNKLGSQMERVERIAALAREIAPKVGADPDEAEQAARVAKADLCSEMVYEFPELQGTMGRYYAQHAGLSVEIANACEAHYAPLGPSDDVPTEPVSIAVALADKLDILTGFWAIDEKPTGSKDPFALRRAALGVIRILMERDVRMHLGVVFHDHLTSLLRDSLSSNYHRQLASIEGLEDSGVSKRNAIHLALDLLEKLPSHESIMEKMGEKIHQTTQDFMAFLGDRLRVSLRDRGIKHDQVEAVLQLETFGDLCPVVNRVRALQDFLGTDDGANLLTGYKRASNIVNDEEKKDGVEYSGAPDVKFAEQDEERALFAALDTAEPAIAQALGTEDFSAAMAHMASLRAPIDTFFDKVTVNAENSIVRRNRLCLLTRVRDAMKQVAIWDAIEG